MTYRQDVAKSITANCLNLDLIIANPSSQTKEIAKKKLPWATIVEEQ